MSKIRTYSARMAILCLISLASALAYAQVTESQLRAAFVVRLGSFWDRTHDGNVQNDTIAVGVIGDDSVNAQLKSICSTLSTQTPAFKYYEVKNAGDIDACNILYVGSQCPNSGSVVEQAERNGCLTIGDEQVSARAKTAVTLFVADNKLHLQINLDALDRANVHLDSRVLKLSNTVRDSDL